MALASTRLVAPDPQDSDPDASLRPLSLAEFTGQAAARESLRVFIEAARARREANLRRKLVTCDENSYLFRPDRGRHSVMNRSALRPQLMSLDDFEELLADAPEDERWELISGRIVRMMVGARWEHNQIISNLNVALLTRFRSMGSPCRTLVESFRLKEQASSSSLLPDLLVYCTRPPPGATSLSDATVIIEVLSKGTARRDREDKWAVYQTLPSLKHYVLVTRDSPHVETIDRIDGVWAGHRIVDGVTATLAMPGVGVEMPLSEIYADLFD